MWLVGPGGWCRSCTGVVAGCLAGFDVDALVPRRPLDPVLDDLHFVLVVLGGVVLVVDIAPRGADVLGRVDRVLLVGLIGECDIAEFAEPFFRADIFATVNVGSHSYRPFRPLKTTTQHHTPGEKFAA